MGETAMERRRIYSFGGGEPEGSASMAALLVSVRSGAAQSMPGMMETVLNLGLNPDTAAALEARTRDARFVWDTYRRFVQMFSNVVAGLPHEPFEHAIEAAKKKAGVAEDT